MTTVVRPAAILLLSASVVFVTPGCSDRDAAQPPNVRLDDTGNATGTNTGTGSGGGSGTDATVCQCLVQANESADCAACINDAAAVVCAEEANIYGGDGPSALIVQCLDEHGWAPESIGECIGMTPDQEHFLNLWGCACADCSGVCAGSEPETCESAPTPDNCGCIVDQITPGSPCGSCANLSTTGECSVEYDACIADSTCDAILTSCMPACEGSASLTACVSACLGASDSPSRALAEAFYACSCENCQQCPTVQACVAPGGTGTGTGTGTGGMGGMGGTGGTP